MDCFIKQYLFIKSDPIYGTQDTVQFLCVCVILINVVNLIFCGTEKLDQTVSTSQLRIRAELCKIARILDVKLLCGCSWVDCPGWWGIVYCMLATSEIKHHYNELFNWIFTLINYCDAFIVWGYKMSMCPSTYFKAVKV